MWNEFNLEGAIDSFAYWIQLKSIYRRPVFYNFNAKKVAALLGVSINCLKHHLEVLKKMGAIQFKDNHLSLLGFKQLLKKFPSRSNRKLKVSYCIIKNSIKDTKAIVQSLPVYCNIARQAKRIMEWDPLDEKNAAKVIIKKDRSRKCHFAYVALTNKKLLACMYRKSVSTAQRRKAKLKKLNTLNYRYKFVRYAVYLKFFDKFVDDVKKILIGSDGNFYIQIPNQFMLVGEGYNNKYIVADFKLDRGHLLIH